MASKRLRAAMKVAGKKVPITAAQRRARRINIEIARRAKRSGGSRVKRSRRATDKMGVENMPWTTRKRSGARRKGDKMGVENMPWI